MHFEKALRAVLNWEGEYSNDSRDPGGETKYGISKRVYPDLDIAALTVFEAAGIYRRDYWNVCMCDKFEWPVALMLFDTAVNMGVATAVKILQEICGASVDGRMGPETIQLANLRCSRWLVREYAALRLIKYTTLKNWDIYCNGWAKRLVDIVIKSIKNEEALL